MLYKKRAFSVKNEMKNQQRLHFDLDGYKKMINSNELAKTNLHLTSNNQFNSKRPQASVEPFQVPI